MTEHNNHEISKFFSLKKSLVLWFLLLSLTPLILVSWISYEQAKTSLTLNASESLEDTSKLSVNFILNWFDYRLIDLKHQAETRSNSHLLSSLIVGFNQSRLSLNDYIKSSDWLKKTDDHSGQLIQFRKHYEYIYDVLLIDLKGNILFSIEKKSDLGTNLIEGKYSKTLFAKSFKNTLKTGNAIFSDIEFYEPSKNTIAGFMTAPLLDEFGEKIGVIAFRIQIDPIFNLLHPSMENQSSMVGYLVGEDGKLRTAINNEKEILKRKIVSDDQKESVFYYQGAAGVQVLGIHRLINLPGVKWVLITEINESETLESASWLGRVTIILVMLTMVVVVVVAVIKAVRITKPIITLADTSMKVAAGELDQKVNISANNEIGKLGDAFNHMLSKRHTYEKELEKRTKESKRVFAELEEQKFALDQHSIVAITNVKGDITFANPKFAEISGFNIEELMGKNHRILNSGYHDKSFFKDMYQTIAKGDVWNAEVCNRAKNGSSYWVDTTIVPFIGEDGKPKSYIAIRTDITKRKWVEKEVQETARFSLDNPSPILKISSDYEIVFANPSANEILKIQNRKVGDRVSQEWQKFIGMVFKSTETIQFEDNIQGRSYLYIVTYVDTQSVNVYGADITTLKQFEAELVEAKELAEDAFKSKGEFLASMSHEIRTPMNGVLGMLSLLNNTELDDVQKHRVKIAQSSAQSLLALINDILDFSKVEAGKMDLEILDFNLRGMFGEFAEAMGHQAQGKGLELILDVTGIEQSTVKGDPGRIRQIVTNLVGNAIKFTTEGEIVIRVDLQSHSEDQYRLHCSICDTGIGIPEEKLTGLFDSFSQVDASTTRKYGGTGLGLSIAKKLCELMGGDIGVTSKQGKGSCFEINILLDKSNLSELVVPEVDMQSLNLLIVDDNATNREVLRSQLEHWGANVEEAENGSEAINMCEERVSKFNDELFDIAFLDMQMPGMDGAELGALLRRDKRFESMKLVMMTSMDFQGDARRFAELGFSGYFPKPATTSDLFVALSLVAVGGEILSKAEPLVTPHYLKTLTKDRDTDAGKEEAWSETTRILLVEDNQVNQIVAMTTLETFGVSVEIAGNGIEALAALNNAPTDSPFSMVFMDCQMPEMDGFEACQKVRAGDAGEEYIQIPIIALTANAMKEDKDRCIAAGMDDYLAKPFESEQLYKKLAKWLA